MSEWRDTTLGEFVGLQRGHDLTEPQRRIGHVPVMGSAGQNGFHDTARAKGPGIVVGRSGASFGQVHFSPVDYWPHNTALYVTDFKSNDERFAFYFLKVIDFSGYNSGIAQPSLNRNFIYSIPVRIPPLAEQKAIAAVLGALDDKIELNRRMNATLEAMARALFQSWFVDFAPVRAKLDGRKPIGLDETTAALFPEHLEDSPLGHIPKGWTATTLGACIGFRSGFSFKSQDWQESGVPVVKIGSVKPGIIDLTQVSYVSEEIAQQAARYRLRTGDMLIGMTGYVGEVGLVPPSDNPPLLNQRVGKFVMAKPGTESLGIWYCTTRQPEFKAFVEARSHGTAQANVSGESIMEFPLVVPPSGILDAFNRECQPLLDRILSNHGESRTLATLRDTLLPKLLSGELSVEDGSYSKSSNNSKPTETNP